MTIQNLSTAERLKALTQMVKKKSNSSSDLDGNGLRLFSSVFLNFFCAHCLSKVVEEATIIGGAPQMVWA